MILGSNISADTQDERTEALTNLSAVFAILSMVSDAFCACDVDGHIFLANENLATLTGLSRNQLVGIDIRALLFSERGVPVSRQNWPFSLDGTEKRLLCRKPNNMGELMVRVKARQLGDTDIFMVVLRPESAEVLSEEVVEAAEKALSATTEELEALEQQSNALGTPFPRELETVAQNLYLRLHMNGTTPTLEDYRLAFGELAKAMDCVVWDVSLGQDPASSKVLLPSGKTINFPFVYKDFAGPDGGIGVHFSGHAVSKGLQSWLCQHLGHQEAFLVLLSPQNHEACDFMVVREAGEQNPLNYKEATLFKRFVEDAYRELRHANKIAQDSFIAATLQEGLGNKLQTIKGLSCEALYSSATERASVGGDFYTVMRLSEHSACIVLGDVTGHGVESASVSAAVRTALGAYAWEGLMPSYMVRSLNDFFMGFSRLETFATLFVGIFDTKTGNLTYCNAGHPPALILHKAQASIEKLSLQSGVVGAFHEMIYRDGTAHLDVGDTLLLYTDGVTETRKPDKTFFGEEGLEQAARDLMKLDVHEMPEVLLTKLYDFSDNRLEDDIALMAVRYDGLTHAD